MVDKKQQHSIAFLTHSSAAVKKRVFRVVGLLLLANGLVWVLTFLVANTYPFLLGLALIAYGFGLRHAVDADHIAAIDNTTRKLMQDGKKPITVGLFFSLGHATIVILLSVFLVLFASATQHNLPALKQTGAIIGTSVSSLFLLVIGIINLLAFRNIYSVWRKLKRDGTYHEETIEEYLRERGLLAKILRPVLRMVTKSWHMYPVGLLFGLGFDTASEVGLLSLSAITGTSGVPFWDILLLPLAFTAGMMLIDTLDGILMLGAYGWAFISPVRKLYYNMSITLISVLIAVGIGGVEALQVLSAGLHIHTGVFSFINTIRLDNAGFLIILLFGISWIVAMVIYKLRQYDVLEMV